MLYYYDLRPSIFFTFDRQTAIIRITRQYIYIYSLGIYVCTIRAYACVQASNVRGETAAVSSKQENITIVILSAIIIIHTHASRDEGVSCLIQRTSGMVWKKLRKRETKRNSDDDDDNFSIILVYHHIFYRHRYKDVYRYPRVCIYIYLI